MRWLSAILADSAGNELSLISFYVYVIYESGVYMYCAQHLIDTNVIVLALL